MKKVDKTSSVSIHIQLQSIIKDMIECGELKEGDVLLPEREICKEQEVSRMTVNKAINALVSEGILYRKQGKGTFVAQKKKKYQFNNVKGFTEVMKSRGIDIKTDIIKFEILNPDDIIMEKLGITDKRENVYKIKRIRYVENEPFGYEIAYIPEKVCGGMTKGMLDDNSLYKILENEYGYKVARVEQIIDPIQVDTKVSEKLQCEKGRLALSIQRTSYTEDEKIIEYTVTIIRSDKYQYEINIGM